MLKKNKEWPKELVYVDLNRERFEYYNIELITLGFNNIQVTFHYGKYGNKGTNKITRFKGENAFREANKLAYNQFYKIKNEGFISKHKMEEAIKYTIKQELKVEYDKKISRKNKENKMVKEHSCFLCENPINSQLYSKINSWGRGEGNWDYSQKSPLYKKVVCLDCQMDRKIFQKKIDENFAI